MRRTIRTLLVALILLLWSIGARAQDQPKVGLTMGYPSAIGILWQTTERVALRPELTATRGSSEGLTTDPIVGTSGTSTPSDNWQVGVGLSALFYLTHDGGFRTYVTPRFAYSKTNASNAVSGSVVSSTSDGWTYTTSGSFGAQYSFAKHFGVFGEVGAAYTSSTNRVSTLESITTVIGISPGGPVTRVTSSTFRSDLHSHTIGTRSGAGVIFYF
jgi:hypothetical protein